MSFSITRSFCSASTFVGTADDMSLVSVLLSQAAWRLLRFASSFHFVDSLPPLIHWFLLLTLLISSFHVITLGLMCPYLKLHFFNSFLYTTCCDHRIIFTPHHPLSSPFCWLLAFSQLAPPTLALLSKCVGRIFVTAMATSRLTNNALPALLLWRPFHPFFCTAPWAVEEAIEI